MKYTIALSFLFLSLIAKAQDKVEWDGVYQLRLSDFKSPVTQIGSGNVFSIYTGSGFDFSMHMTNYEFMFTKNFNSKVNNFFSRDAAVISAPDSNTALHLLNFGQYQFDLSELYARKFRQQLYEQKNAFSDFSFVQPAYNKIQKEYAERQTVAGKETELGQNSEKLAELHQAVKDEIALLANYCKTCKPGKKKK